MISFTGTSIPESVKVDLQQRNLGGIILFASSITSPVQIAGLTSQLASLSTHHPLLLAVDQEGGRVARLGALNGFLPTPTAYHLGTRINREDSTRAAAGLMAEWVRQSGFNINFAPVADVNVNINSPAIGKLERSYSSDPDTVYRHASWFIDEFRKKKIITTLKHFPGHGSATTDSHLGFTDVTGTWSDKELQPYRLALKSGMIDMVMAGHLFNAKIDSQHPASLSHAAVTTLLRDSLGFSGVVVSDELFMNAISANYEFDKAIELCVNSGTDILLFNRSIYNNRSLTAYVVDAVRKKVNAGSISVATIDSAYERIQRLKKSILTSSRTFAAHVPSAPGLEQNFPNPFNPSTTITYTLSASGQVSLRVFDLLGKEISLLVNTYQKAGTYSVMFHASTLASGVYFYLLTTANQRELKKMTLVK